MHTLHCIRNITLCTVCDEAIPKKEFEEHRQNCAPNKSSDNENESNKENNVGANANISAATNSIAKSNSSVRKFPEIQKVSMCSTLQFNIVKKSFWETEVMMKLGDIV